MKPSNYGLAIFRTKCGCERRQHGEWEDRDVVTYMIQQSCNMVNNNDGDIPLKFKSRRFVKKKVFTENDIFFDSELRCFSQRCGTVYCYEEE